MKRACLGVFIFLVFFFLYLSIPSSALAAPCPPLGTNIAANFDRANLEFIAQHANCDGPIPITVIITPALVQNPDLLIQLQNDLRDLNFNPTWRPWGYVEPGTKEFQDWLYVFSLLKIGQLQAWNEWNRYTEVPLIDPVRDAELIRLLLDARDRGEITIPIGNTPLDLFNWTDMNYRDYWTLFNQTCPTCLNRLDFLAFNVYTPGQLGPNSPQEFLDVFAKAVDFFRNLGVNLTDKFFIISEAGLNPGAYPNFSQRLRETLLFAQALQAFLEQNPNYLFDLLGIDIDLRQITFLLMDDATGKQYLIYLDCDDEGNCVWRVTEYLIFNINVPGGLIPPTFPPLACNPADGGEFDSRPVPCDACNITELLTPSCATAFTVHDHVVYQRGDVDFWCPGEGPDGGGHPWLEKDWTGIVTIDPSETTIPFVGKKGQEDEQKYLADYFEGTGYYYRPPYDFTKLEDVLRVLEEGGVWRKLAPQQYQDQFKQIMVDRALLSLANEIDEGAIHNYLVEYDGESAHLSEFDGHFPPQDPIERGKWERETIWGRLWRAVPMFSREDTHGHIIPYLGARPEDSFEILNSPAQIEKVPHVARLYEVTQAINQILLPLIQAALLQPQAEIKTPLAAAEERVLGEKAIIAQAAPDFPYGCKWYYSTNPNDPTDCSCMASGTCRGEHGGCCPPHGFWGVCGWDDCQPEVRCPNPPENGCPGTWIVGGPETPEGHECGFRDPLPVDACTRESITDPNPNDDLCCSPINIKLTGVDRFINSDYIPCGVECLKWDEATGECLKDACEETKAEPVNRQIGIQLLHPYLYEIWSYSTENIWGFFNIIRPERTPEFEELDASSTIFYNYTPGNVALSVGDFYYPYLGGIQKAKEWVIKTLNVQETQTY